MMGIGDRFTKGGYTEYKPLIRVNSEILIKKVVKPLIGKFKSIYIICNPSISKQIGSIFDDEVQIIELIENTRGAAETLLKSCAYFEENEQIVCVDCDTIFHDSAIQKITEIEGNSILTFKDEDRTALYSYVKTNDRNEIEEIKEKVAISDIANAGIYVFKNRSILEESCKNILSSDGELYISEAIKYAIEKGEIFKSIDISDEFDCCGTPYQLKTYSKSKATKKVLCFDIDGTLVYDLYKNPNPIEKNVKFCNDSFREGHHIILHTARGMLSKNRNEKLIEEQRPYIIEVLSKAGVMYHELMLMKPYADLYIDDKSIPAHKDLEKETGIYLSSDHSPRAINVVIKDGNQITKLGNLKGESFYYRNLPEDLKKFFPGIITCQDDKIEMTKINESTFSSLLLSKKLTKSDIDLLLETISEIHRVQIDIEIDLLWAYDQKVKERYKSNEALYKSLNVDFLDVQFLISSIYQTNRGMIHGDPVFTNVFIGKSHCKFIDMRGIWDGVPSLVGDIYYDYAKILQSLYGYDYVLHSEPIEEKYLASLREHFIKRIKEIDMEISIDQLKNKTKLLYISMIPIHSEDINRCAGFIKLIKNID